MGHLSQFSIISKQGNQYGRAPPTLFFRFHSSRLCSLHLRVCTHAQLSVTVSRANSCGPGCNPRGAVPSLCFELAWYPLSFVIATTFLILRKTTKPRSDSQKYLGVWSLLSLFSCNTLNLVLWARAPESLRIYCQCLLVWARQTLTTQGSGQQQGLYQAQRVDLGGEGSEVEPCLKDGLTDKTEGG